MGPNPPTRSKLEDVIDTLKERGFTTEFVRQNGLVICMNCGTPILVEDLPVVEEHHFANEGEAGEEAILQAVTCPKCQIPGQVLTGRHAP